MNPRSAAAPPRVLSPTRAPSAPQRPGASAPEHPQGGQARPCVRPLAGVRAAEEADPERAREPLAHLEFARLWPPVTGEPRVRSAGPWARAPRGAGTPEAQGRAEAAMERGAAAMPRPGAAASAEAPHAAGPDAGANARGIPWHPRCVRDTPGCRQRREGSGGLGHIPRRGATNPPRSARFGPGRPGCGFLTICRGCSYIRRSRRSETCSCSASGFRGSRTRAGVRWHGNRRATAGVEVA